MAILSTRAKFFNEVFAPDITHQDLIGYVGAITDWFPMTVVSIIKHILHITSKF
jgi:hypothetical protein